MLFMENVEKSGRDDETQARISPEAVTACAANPCSGVKWVPWMILALALILRLIWLGIKPPHFDEGVNGWFVDQMTKQGYYHYDPGNYHGPFHFYKIGRAHV